MADIQSKKIKLSREILRFIQNQNLQAANLALQKLYNLIYESIPARQRSSRGEVYVIRTITDMIRLELRDFPASMFKIGIELFQNSTDFHIRGIGLNLISYYGIKCPDEVPAYFLIAAQAENWHLREYAQMFFRKIIKEHPQKSYNFLREQAEAKSPYIRIFVAETLRPVQENKWLFQQIDYSLSILKLFYRENHPYPRTAVGNNLSDISKKLPHRVLDIVEQLVSTGDDNSYWIAYRACRNLVKKYPEKVMDILGVDYYKYKSKTFYRDENQRS